MSINLYKTTRGLRPQNWELIKLKANPFLNFNFYSALEESLCLGQQTGWQPLYFSEDTANENGILYCFEKHHSYGEYIFDWDWAHAYQQHGLNYYPKLTSMIPMTPVTASHFIMPKFNINTAQRLLSKYTEYYKNSECSSSHFLFLLENEIPIFNEQGYTIRESIQYHFTNHDYDSFDLFLTTLKSRKASKIKKERKFPSSVHFKAYTGGDIKNSHAVEMYHFYISTIDKKKSMAYLNQRFFEILFATMKDQILYIEATEDQKPIAGALFFYGKDTLYGRYWGTNSNYPHLHFELCYYQGIEFCIKNKLKNFESGAQGEHKISRGFRPIKTYSAHHIKHLGFSSAIKKYILEEKSLVSHNIQNLQSHLPYKN